MKTKEYILTDIEVQVMHAALCMYFCKMNKLSAFYYLTRSLLDQFAADAASLKTA